MKASHRTVYHGLVREKLKSEAQKDRAIRPWGKKSHWHVWKKIPGPIPELTPELCIKCGEVARWGA